MTVIPIDTTYKNFNYIEHLTNQHTRDGQGMMTDALIHT